MSTSWQSLTHSHCAALAELCADNLPLDPFNDEIIDKRIFQDPRYDPRWTLGIEESGRLIAAAVGVVRAVAQQESHGWLKLLVVDRQHREQGLAGGLLRELESRFREAGIRQVDTSGAPYYFWPGVDLRYTAACCFLDKMGYVEQGYHFNMTVGLGDLNLDTGEQEKRLSGEGITFHRVEPRRVPEVVRMIEGHWPEHLDWAGEVAVAAGNDPVSLFCAMHADEVYAFAAYNVAMFPGTFGPTGTVPSMQGRGIGTVLLYQCLADMRRLGYDQCEIGWVEPVCYYSKKLGASVHRTFRDYRKLLPA